MLKFQFDRRISRCKISSYYGKMTSWKRCIKFSSLEFLLRSTIQIRNGYWKQEVLSNHFTKRGDVKLYSMLKQNLLGIY